MACACHGGTARQQLAFSGEQLNDALGRFKTAEKWRHFLAVAPEEPLDSDQLYHINAARAAKLKTVLENFDSAAADEQYSMISSLPEFERTRGLLAGYLTRIGNVQNVTPVSSLRQLRQQPRKKCTRSLRCTRRSLGIGRRLRRNRELGYRARAGARYCTTMAEELPMPPAAG